MAKTSPGVTSRRRSRPRLAADAGACKAPVERAAPVLPVDRAACACTVLRRAARHVTKLYDDALAPTGLRITQYSLLAKLDRSGAVAMTDLADLLSMERTTLTRNLGPLHRDGLLSLQPAGHGRTKLVALTGRGRRKLRDAFPFWEQAQQRFRETVGAAASGQFFHVAESIGACLGDAAG